MNKIGRYMHATGSHAGTDCMRQAATRLQFACDWRPAPRLISPFLSCPKASSIRRIKARGFIEIPLMPKHQVLIDNDPSAGSPKETLLRFLLPLSATVWSSFHQRGSVNRQASSPRALKRSIGSSDGRCVQRAGT
jgi:hypothetical protein